MNNLIVNNSLFENIKHLEEEGREYWTARELYKIFEYNEYRKFLPTINKAKIACIKSGYNEEDHFVRVGGMVKIGSNATREVSDYRLSRYACYLIAQNADPKKEIVSLAQTYFAGNSKANSPYVMIRPVVSLKPGIEFLAEGDGTPTNPYIVKYN